MNNFRQLIETIDQLNEAQQHEFLDAIVDKYAKDGMTLADVSRMEADARSTRPPEGLFSGFITPDYRARYVLAHASKKLGVGGLFNSQGNVVWLDDRGEVKSARGDAGVAKELAAKGLVSPEVAKRYNIELPNAEEPTKGASGQDSSGVQTFPVKPPAEITVKPIDTAAPAGTDTQDSSLKSFLNKGHKGLYKVKTEFPDAVGEVQTFLRDQLGINIANDKQYGPKTIKAVKQFQAGVGINADGDVGIETVTKIEEFNKDIKEIEKLVNALSESIVAVNYKSSISKLLERALSDVEKERLKALVSKYQKLTTTIPSLNPKVKELLTKGAEASGVKMSTSTAQPTNAPANSPTSKPANAPTATNTGTGQFDPAVPAKTIYDAVNGMGTDEAAIQAGLKQIANITQWQQSDKAAKSAYGKGLLDLIKSDMSVEDDLIQYVYPELRRIKVPHIVEVRRISQLSLRQPFAKSIAPFYDAQGNFPPKGPVIADDPNWQQSGTRTASNSTAPSPTPTDTTQPAPTTAVRPGLVPPGNR